MRTGIYAIFDKVANDLFGGQHALLISREDAAAVRVYTELLSDPKTIVGKYPADHDLLFLGELEEDYCISDDSLGHQPRTVLEGQAWLALNKPPTPEPELDPHGTNPATNDARARALRERNLNARA